MGRQNNILHFDNPFSCYYQPNNYLRNSSLLTLNTAIKHISLIHADAYKQRINKQNQRKLSITLSTMSEDKYEHTVKRAKSTALCKKCNPSRGPTKHRKVAGGYRRILSANLNQFRHRISGNRPISSFSGLISQQHFAVSVLWHCSVSDILFRLLNTSLKTVLNCLNWFSLPGLY